MNRDTQGRLIRVQSPLTVCQDAPDGAACRDLFKELKNPYFIGDTVGLTQTTGWVDAWTLQQSVYAVAAETTADVVAAVNFARQNNLRLVVRGGGHSYLGTSNAPDSLLIWTRRMNAITLHDAFVPQGCAGRAGAAAGGLGRGRRDLDARLQCGHHQGRPLRAGRRLQHGRRRGTGAGRRLRQLLQVSTARPPRRCWRPRSSPPTARCGSPTPARRPDLFWALKGGGGGSFGVVTRLTLAHPRPADILRRRQRDASTRRPTEAYRRLLGRFVDFYADSLFNPHWGEIATLRPGNRLEITMAFQGLDRAAGGSHLAALPRMGGRGIERLRIPDHAADPRWRRQPSLGPGVSAERVPGAVLSDDRPGAPSDNIFWSANLSEAGHFIHGYESAWLPAALLQRTEQRTRLADALFAASRHWSVELHFQKGLAGAAGRGRSRPRADTAMNPAVLDAFVLAIIAGEGPPAYPGLPATRRICPRRGATRVQSARRRTCWQARARARGRMSPKAATSSASGSRRTGAQNYPRLLADQAALRSVDGLFIVHHGVGSEEWSADGFTRLAAR